jgi:hypothetical protein
MMPPPCRQWSVGEGFGKTLSDMPPKMVSRLAMQPVRIGLLMQAIGGRHVDFAP